MVLTVAGSDSSSGAGLQADLKTFAAHGVHGVNAATALVAEIPGEVAGIQAVDPTLLRIQLDRVDSAFPLAAAKTGMLAGAALVEAVADFFAARPRIPLVVDPVVRAGSGAELLPPEGLEALRNRLLPLARLATPNLPEAELLLGEPLRTPREFAEAPRRLSDLCGCDILLKGGHFPGGGEVTDHAWIEGAPYSWSRPRLAAPDVHGTGCALSAAVAARIALGQALPDAVSGALAYLAACLEEHWSWPAPRGGPRGVTEALNHFPRGVESPQT